MSLLLLACADPPDVDSAPGDSAGDTGTDAPPEWCPSPDAWEVTDTPASPYLVRHPDGADPDAPAVVFLPGGGGDQGSAQAMESLYLTEGRDGFRTAVPWSLDASFYEDPSRAPLIAAELLACFGGGDVHLAGTSNGGLGAFEVMVEDGGAFASLLGAPGAWMDFDADDIAEALDGRPVLMTVGSEDTDWFDGVQDQADRLAAAGADATFLVLEGEGHVVGPEFDESVFFEFWSR